MQSTAEDAVRQAVLDLALLPNLGLNFEEVAKKSGVPVETVEAVCPDPDRLVAFTLTPLGKAVDDVMRQLPIHREPTPAQQREVLEALLDASLEFPQHQALVIRMLTSNVSRITGRADIVAYQAGLRLMGVNYDTDPDFITRVYFATEMIALSVATHRHDFTNPRTRELLISSMLAILRT